MAKEMDRVIGIALRNARRKRGLTQKEVAEALHTTQTFVSKIETGKRSLRAAEAAMYNIGLGTTFRQFYNEIHAALKDSGFV